MKAAITRLEQLLNKKSEPVGREILIKKTERLQIHLEKTWDKTFDIQDLSPNNCKKGKRINRKNKQLEQVKIILKILLINFYFS